MKKLLFPIFIVILILITAVLIFAAVTTKQEVTTPITTQSVEPYASLTFAPETLTISPANYGTQSVDIILDTKGKGVFGAQIELQYDPLIISDVEISKPANSLFGETSSELINNVSSDTGLATYAVVLSPTDSEKVGKGPVATVKFNVNAPGTSTNLTILPTSSITNLTDDASVLLNSTLLPITFISQ